MLGRISPIFPPFFLVFCAFSPPGRDGSIEPQAETQGQETAGKGTKRGELPPSSDTPGANQRINCQRTIFDNLKQHLGNESFAFFMNNTNGTGQDPHNRLWPCADDNCTGLFDMDMNVP